MNLSLNDYQESAGKYQISHSPPEERVFGLLEEAGEVAAIFKRLLRGDYNPDQCATKLHAELGDILWYLSRIAADNNWELNEVAQANLDKLESRQLRNKIMGTGDER